MASWGEYLARGLRYMTSVSCGEEGSGDFDSIMDVKLLFLDYDSTLNPGQGNAPLSEARAEMLGAYFKRWRSEVPRLRIYVLTVSNPAVKRRRLEEASLIDCFDDVLSSSMPEVFDSKGEYLVRFLANAGVPAKAAMHVDDSHYAIESILNNPTGLTQPVCHTLRLPYASSGLAARDMHTIGSEFVYRQASDGEFFNAYSFEFAGERRLDLRDKPVKCMLDGMELDTLRQVIQSNRERDHFASWLDGRPDFANLAE